MRSPHARTWLLYLPLCFFSTTLAVGTWDARGGVSDSLLALAWLAGLTLSIAALACRRRYPEGAVLVTSALTALLPLDPVAALIAFGSMTVRRLDRVTAGLAAVVLAATTVSTWRDGQAVRSDAGFWQMMRSSDSGTVPRAVEPISLPVVLTISVVLVAVTFGVAMIVRDVTRNRERRVSDERQQVVVDNLSSELARQAERERIAREVHDALGHRLSMLSLHAGALEVTVAGGDPRAAQSAALVRANAQQVMADLRQLLATLDTPDAPDVASAVPTLRDVSRLVDESTGAGIVLVSTVQLESLDRLDPQTSRSAFRLAQELLTNARRHAPGIGVRLLVRAGPDHGVTVEVANYLPAGVEPSVAGRSGRGLTGARTRVEQHGGQWRCWVDDERVFRVAAHLPWVWAGGEAGPGPAAQSPAPPETRPAAAPTAGPASRQTARPAAAPTAEPAARQTARPAAPPTGGSTDGAVSRHSPDSSYKEVR